MIPTRLSMFNEKREDFFVMKQILKKQMMKIQNGIRWKKNSNTPQKFTTSNWRYPE
jgi:hypothetical protein